MRVAVSGATGLVGRRLARRIAGRGDNVIALTRERHRGAEALGGEVEVLEWPRPQSEPPPAEALEGADAVIHLLGEPVAQRWSGDVKQRIRESRILSTEQLVDALARLPEHARPRVLVSQSATGFYGPRDEQPVDETTAAGSDFLAGVVVDWEERAARAAELGVRVAMTRTGVALASDGGALATMLPPFRLGVGGPVAGGRQYVPWVHLDDVVGALLHCLDDPGLSGPVNVTAPHPVTNAELSRTLGRVLHRPAVLPVPAVALRLLYGEMATIVTTGHNAVPSRLQDTGYSFAFAELEPALRDVLGRT